MERDILIEFEEAITHKCDVRLVREILIAGASVNVRFENGVTPLMLTVIPNKYGDQTGSAYLEKMVEFLLANGADISLTDNYGKKAVDYAVMLTDKGWKDLFGDGYANDWFSEENTRNISSIINLLSCA